MLRLMLLISVITLYLVACSTPTPYGPMTGRYGYAEQRIEADRFRVLFHGNESTPREQVETFLLYRAAELTLENGFDYFLVIEQDTDISRTYTSTRFEPPLDGYYAFGHQRFPYYAYGYPWSFNVDVRERRQFEAHAFIVLRKGESPEGDPHAFDADEVVRNLKPRVQESLARS